MKFLTHKSVTALVIFSLFTFTSFAHVLVSYIPLIIEISKQALLSLTLISCYLLNIKPELPSQADQAICQPQGIKTSLFHQFLQDISKQTGIVISPEVLNQLKNAGMHHDYQKLGTLLSSLDKNNKLIGSAAQSTEINPYAHTLGIKKYTQPGAYAQISQSAQGIKTSSKPAEVSFQTAITSTQNQASKPAHTSFATNSVTREYLHEFGWTSNSAEQRLVLNSDNQARNNNFAPTYMHQMMRQQLSYSAQKAVYEWENAYNSVAEHFHTPALRRELYSTIQAYKNVIQNACQMGGSPEAIRAQTQIALQGLSLPGFLNEFSTILQEKVSRICFTPSGQWKGIESNTQLQELEQACKPFLNAVNSVSTHMRWQTPAYAHECIEELYLMDQGRGSWASRFFSWVGGFLDSQAVPITELQARIAANSFNQQAFSTLELLETNEFKLARIPLEDMTRSAKTANSIQLNQALLAHYRNKIEHYYGTAKIPLTYQNDPVFWLYAPSAQHLKWDDPALKLIEAHLAIRNTIYNQIIKAICKNQEPNQLIRHLAYGIIDKLNDPIALIDQFEFLSADSASPEIQQAYHAFFDNGVLNLFSLKKQAIAHNVQLSDGLNQAQYAHMRTALNKLLLVDARSQESRRSIKLVFDCLPHACTNGVFSKDYQNIIQAITQAHIDAMAPKGILHISCFPINPTKDLHITLLKAMSKAAREDLGIAKLAPNSPVSTREAWAYIQKVQDLETKGETSLAHAVSNTYLRGYLDGKIPIKDRLTPFIIIVGSTSGIWYANSGEKLRKISKFYAEMSTIDCPSKDITTVNEKENEEQFNKNLKSILIGASPGEKTSNKKSKQYKKNGGVEDVDKDFEKFNPSNVRSIPIGKVGDLPNGRKIIARSTSSGKTPTLEIQNLINGKVIKIRYIS